MPSGVSGTLTKDGRLTRAGMRFLGGLGLLILVGVALEWRALSAVLLGQRLPGTVVDSVPDPADWRDYRVRVAFETAGARVEFDRSLRQRSRSQTPRLAIGDRVEVLYHRAVARSATLDHPHENWRGAPVAAVSGAGLVCLAWYWRPTRSRS